MEDRILIEGARQNNLRNLTLELPLGELTVITGVSGSGKSSLAFDTIYAEGQRRYVETFSPYARQFLERMDKPQVDAIRGIPPAIAIDQTNPVRTSRSTVGTMTELNDYLKLLFARAARLHCRGCGSAVHHDSPDAVAALLSADPALAGEAAEIRFFVDLLPGMDAAAMTAVLGAQGYTRVSSEGERLAVVQDRLRLSADNRSRLQESLEAAFRVGRGRVTVRLGRENGTRELRFSAGLHCAACDIAYQDVSPNSFSFNSPVGACETCRGFGRTIGIDYRLVIPDTARSLSGGAVKPWQTASFSECQKELEKYARKRRIRLDVPWSDLADAERNWVIEGEGDIDSGTWYGIRRFFAWLETKSYKMHLRVLLSKYRSYDDCRACNGARLKPDALLWQLPGREQSLNFPGVVQLPIRRARDFIEGLRLGEAMDEASALVLAEIRSRLGYLVEVGLGYISLDRQSRTLSGGEVQRINLTTALGTSLVNTLFVLDEPSIGLHPRDIGRVVGVLERLRDAGNTLLVVEHDPQFMVAADRLIDMGPGPGRAGGSIVYEGPPAGVTAAKGSLTAAYLLGIRSVSRSNPRAVRAEGSWLELRGAAEHNLQDIDVRIPLGHLVCVTGISGSGKSTLVSDVLYGAVGEALGKTGLHVGTHAALFGAEKLVDVVLVDQAPIGKSARSNPVSYVGAWAGIRELFGRTPLAKERGYTAGTFSFNSGDGRCPACTGSGFEHVEMQFLSDVYLRCTECDGKRFRAEVLEVRLAGGENIAEVLGLSVAEALERFDGEYTVLEALQPLRDVGLEYLALGQPVPTLSGGEAQRLKLAGHLAEAGSRKARKGAMLFVFDEPTTGLHFEDIARLLGAFDKLIAAGHTLLVIEHNLDVIEAADWLIDLGPEGGEGGGLLVFSGTPADIIDCTESHTGTALRDYRRAREGIREAAPIALRAPRVRVVPQIEIQRAREHNLKDIDITIPRDALTVITGISGSGKSTVAFDILFAEGQRRYLESLNAYARQFVQPAARPDVDAIRGIPPSVAVEQRTSRGGRKSTVATATELYHYLRLLFVKLGVQHCPDCQTAIEAQSVDLILSRIQRDFRGQKVQLLAPLVVARKGYYTDLAAWAAKRGHATLRVDGEFLPTEPWPRLDRFREHSIELPMAEIDVGPRNRARLAAALAEALEAGNGMVQLLTRGRGRPRLASYSTRRACPGCQRSFPELDPRLFSYNSAHGWCVACFGTGLSMEGFDGEQTGEEHLWTDWWQGGEKSCMACAGQRLKPEGLAVKLWDRGIADYNAMTVDAASGHFNALKLAGRAREIARDILPELKARLGFLREVGLGYLTLERSAPSLSGGEAQRIRLAAQLGSNLRGVCYILDEPTIGLHPRDNEMLLGTLDKLRAKGNTVVVVEHDEETIRRADYVVDLGPGAGRAGGEVVAAGTFEDILRAERSETARCLREPLPHPMRGQRRAVDATTPLLRVHRAKLHNLDGLDAVIPLGRLVALSGVSGSGKSTLMRDVLEPNLRAALAATRKSRLAWQWCDKLEGWEQVERVLEVDQTPIGKTPRSCPATYVGVWDAIRKLYASTPEARLRGFAAGRFSFNTAGGRCEACEGQGVRKVEMSFLPDVSVLCEECRGGRFNAETLQVAYRGKSISDVLEMSVTDAATFFAAHPSIARALQLMCEVGLGYLRLGQPSPTLSGGEAQRIKLVTELARVKGEPATRTGPQPLYLLDEPTVGLHMADVEKLLDVMHRLVEGGASVLVIEHNLDVLAEADWLIDLGPEGGGAGGRIVAAGTPELVAATKGSHTGKVLKTLLKRARAVGPTRVARA